MWSITDRGILFIIVCYILLPNVYAMEDKSPSERSLSQVEKEKKQRKRKLPFRDSLRDLSTFFKQMTIKSQKSSKRHSADQENKDYIYVAQQTIHKLNDMVLFYLENEKITNPNDDELKTIYKQFVLMLSEQSIGSLQAALKELMKDQKGITKTTQCIVNTYIESIQQHISWLDNISEKSLYTYNRNKIGHYITHAQDQGEIGSNIYFIATLERAIQSFIKQQEAYLKKYSPCLLPLRLMPVFSKLFKHIKLEHLKAALWFSEPVPSLLVQQIIDGYVQDQEGVPVALANALIPEELGWCIGGLLRQDNKLTSFWMSIKENLINQTQKNIPDTTLFLESNNEVLNFVHGWYKVRTVPNNVGYLDPATNKMIPTQKNEMEEHYIGPQNKLIIVDRKAKKIRCDTIIRKISQEKIIIDEEGSKEYCFSDIKTPWYVNAKHALVLTYDKSYYYVYDLEDGICLRTIKPEWGEDFRSIECCISPDRRWLCLAGIYDDGRAGIWLYDLQIPEQEPIRTTLPIERIIMTNGRQLNISIEWPDRTNIMLVHVQCKNESCCHQDLLYLVQLHEFFDLFEKSSLRCSVIENFEIENLRTYTISNNLLVYINKAKSDIDGKFFFTLHLISLSKSKDINVSYPLQKFFIPTYEQPYEPVCFINTENELQLLIRSYLNKHSNLTTTIIDKLDLAPLVYAHASDLSKVLRLPASIHCLVRQIFQHVDNEPTLKYLLSRLQYERLNWFINNFSQFLEKDSPDICRTTLWQSLAEIALKKTFAHAIVEYSHMA